MAENGEERLAAEQRARALIDGQLEAAGWAVQDRAALNLFAPQRGIAVREVIMKPGHGRVDYLLYVDKAVVGVIEAKPTGTPLSGVEWQSAMYATGLPDDVRRKALDPEGRLPFVFEASGTETHFTNGFDPEPRARRIFSFPKPETLAATIRAARERPDHAPTWRGKVRALPALDGPRCVRLRSMRSLVSSAVSPSSASSVRSCRWQRAQVRRTQRSPRRIGC